MTDASTGPTRELILASAGSGKTFTISSRIIGLLASGEAPASILASTFTRKAAGEILDRVLLRLARAALDDNEATTLAGFALGRRVTEDGERIDAGFWRGILRSTVRELHRLDIGTLDAFFVRVLRGFAWDLGIVPGWTMADERASELLRREAIEQVLEAQDFRFLIETLRAMQAEAVPRRIHGTLDDQIDDLLEVHRDLAEPSDSAPGWSAIVAAVGERPDDLDARLDAAVEWLREAAEGRLPEAQMPTNKDKKTLNRPFANGLASLADKIEERDWSGAAKSKLTQVVISPPDDGPATYNRKEIPGPVQDKLREVIDLAQRELGAELAARAEALGRLADVYEKTWEARVRESGLLRFGDVTRLAVSTGTVDGIAPLARGDLFYRLGTPTRHLLLDEFQDTSALQYAALRPVIERVLDNDLGAVTVVADPKQSIYGWRGAAPVVVRAVGDRYPLLEDRLLVSYRSSPVVLDAVNRVFDGIENAPTFTDDDGLNADHAAEWAEAFEPHVAHFEDYPGRVRLLAGPMLDSTSSATSHPRYFRGVAEHVRDLAEELPGLSIGVLVRRNDNVARLIHELGLLGVRASEEGGTRLIDAGAVVSILALLRMADHPGDRISRYHVAGTPVGTLVDYRDATDDRGAVRVSRIVRRRLVEDGYGPTITSWARELQSACDARDAGRMERLAELGFHFDRSPQGGTLRVGEFVKIAEKAKAESPGDDAVRVMTVHGSKGLEFDCVVLPELHASMMGKGRTGPIARRADGVGEVTHAFPRISKELVGWFVGVEALREGRAQEDAAALRDALGALYVGMTRARYVLDMIVPGDDEKVPGGKSHGRLLRERLSSHVDGEPVGPGEVHFDSSREGGWDRDALLARVGTERSAAPSAPVRRPVLDLRSSGTRTRNLERTSPSAKEGGDEVKVRFLLGLTDLRGNARDRGTLVHAWLEEVEWLDDGLPDETRLRAIARRELPRLTDDEFAVHLEWLRQKLQSTAVLEGASRAGRAVPSGVKASPDELEYRVLAEVPFLRRDGDALMEGFIDRLVLVEKDGAPVGAEIVDWKTDRLADGEGSPEERVDDRTEHYRPQIRAYREAVAELYDLDPERIRGRLIFLDAGVVREV